MTVRTQITFKDFLMFHIKSSLLRLAVFLLILLLFFIIKESVDGSTEKDLLQSVPLWFAILILFIAIRSFFSVRFAFNSNKNIQESITYIFTDNKIRMVGQTFDEDVPWSSIYKIKENKDWFLMYQSAKVMNMVPKKFFTKDQVSELRNMIKTNNIKAKLRND